MDLARSGGVLFSTPVFSAISTTLEQSLLHYDPGSKVGLGFGADEWKFNAEYTWITREGTSRGSRSSELSLPA